MRKSVKKILSLAVATTVLAVPVSSLAATVYVGEVGFDTNKVASDSNYKSAFNSFLVQNVGNGVKVDFNDDGKAVSTNAFANSGSTNIAQYDATNGTTVPANYKVWDGTGTPGNPVVSELKVESVSAINAKEIKVVFSTAVDKTTAEDTGKYIIDGVAGDAGASANTLDSTNGAKLQKDKKTVILKLDQGNVSYTKGKVLSLVIDGVQKENDPSVVLKDAKVVTLNDTIAPKLVGVTSKAAATTTSITVEFDEPVQANGLYKINGVTAAAAVNSSDEYKVDLVAGKALEAGKSYTLEVYNEEDLSSPVNTVTTTKAFTVTSQTTAPKLASATAKDDNKIKLVFADDVDPATITPTNVKVLDENSTALTATTHYTISQPDSNNDKEYIINIDNAYALYSTDKTRSLTVAVTKNVNDKLGNEFTPTTKTVALNEDTTKPVAQSARVLKDTAGDVIGFEITFDSELDSSIYGAIGDNNVTTTGIRAVNSNAKEITGDLGLASSEGDVLSTNPNVLVVMLAGGAVSLDSDVNGSVSLIVPAGIVGDDSNAINGNTAKTLNVDLGQPNNGKLTATIADLTNNKYTVQFSEDVSLDSVTNRNNYRLDNVVLPEGTLFTYVKATKTVTIELPSDYVNTEASDSVLRVSGVKNTSGTKTVETTTDVVATVDQVKPELKSAKILDNKTILLTYDEDMSAAITAGTNVGNEFKIYENGTEVSLINTELTAERLSGYNDQVKLTVNKAATLGTAEVNTLTVANPVGAATGGNITVTFNDGGANVVETVAVANSDTTTQVASKIATAFSGLTGYNVTSSGANVLFTASAPAADKTVTVSIADTDTTGVGIATSSQTTAGVAPTAARTLDLDKIITIKALTGVNIKDASTNNIQKASSTAIPVSK